jgi:hypothetical protein
MNSIAAPGALLRPVMDGRLALTLAGHDRI